LRSCLIEKGRSNRRERNVPAIIVGIQGRTVETLTSSTIHEDRLAGGHPANPRIAKSPYWSGASAAAVSRISDRKKKETFVVASAGIATGWEGTVDGGAAAGGAVSVCFEKSYMLRVASDGCICGG
jgi:hypothetical protein